MAAKFNTDIVRFGMGGLDLRRPVDAIAPNRYSRLQNVQKLEDGSFTARLGQTSITDAIGTNHHSVKRLNDPQGSTWTRIWGIDQTLYYGQSATLTSAETGFSGDPLTMVPYRPKLSGDTWMYVGDRTKMRKIRTDGLDLPIGGAAPGAALTAALGSELTVAVEEFESGFTGRAGTSGGIVVSNPAGKSSNALQMAITAPATLPAAGNYYAYAEKSFGAVDLTTFGSSIDATDDDLFHFWLRMDRPDQIEEVHLYLIASSFSSSSIPGVAAGNPDAYLKVFKGSDLQSLIELSQSHLATVSQIAAADTVDTALGQIDIDKFQDDERYYQVIEQTDPSRAIAQSQVAGRDQWTEYGIVGRPLRRGDFQRIGSDTAATWATIRGVIVLVKVKTLTSVNVYADQLFLRGGRGLDTSEPGNAKYDWRYTHYDPRTGWESNPAPVMADADHLDSLRRAVTLTPASHSDSNIRQRFYRRGGTVTDDWYYLGQNSANGGTFSDTLSDADVVAAGAVQTNHYAPAPTVDENGTTVLGQAIPVLFGPIEDLIFGLGDPYRPGHLYFCLPGEPDHWPAENVVEVCSPSEELMNGCLFGAQAYCFSRERMYAIYPNIAGSGTVTVTPTACTKGMVARWAMTTGGGAVWFVSNDGIYMTTGGTEVSITDDLLRGLFHGETRQGYLPIDLTATAALRLEVFDGHLLFQYQDSGGTRRILRYSISDREWIYWTMAVQTSCLYAESNGGALTLLMGGCTTGRSYTYSGTSDAGTAIACQIRTAALDQGNPRTEKSYGDIIVDANRSAETLTVQCFMNNGDDALTSQAVSTGTGRGRSILDPFGTTPQQARNIAIDLSWSTTSTSPIVYLVGVSYIIYPEDIIGRPTDWDNLGIATDKYIKGVLVECDTDGLDKTLAIEGDGATITSVTANASGRQLLEFSFAQTRARLVRLRATNANAWKVFSIQWIFDVEPYKLTRYETQITDHGIPSWMSAVWADITLSSVSSVTLTVTSYNQAGVVMHNQSYDIPTTSNLKQKCKVDFQANKGVLYKYTLVASLPFWLYREETTLYIQPWQGQPVPVHPFGNDDLDPSRGMSNAELSAARGGGTM